MKTDPAAIRRASDGHDVELSLDAWGRLVLITPRAAATSASSRSAPSRSRDPTRWISFCDAEGREVYCLRSLDGLDPRRETLARRRDLARANSCP